MKSAKICSTLNNDSFRDICLHNFHVMLFSYIHGDGKVSRNFIYVSDVVDAFDIILHRGTAGSTYNIGTTFEISVISLARYLIQKVRLSVCTVQTIIYCSPS